MDGWPGRTDVNHLEEHEARERGSSSSTKIFLEARERVPRGLLEFSSSSSSSSRVLLEPTGLDFVITFPVQDQPCEARESPG
mmetsp:Transcript_8494/g.24992  ORF Transcript_8494/g.24992 Transcript_8494/m.24992 type:complete len:82 (-) Transcript_8494:17-262(-)